MTAESARRLAERGVSRVTIERSVPADTLAHLAAVPTLRDIACSGRSDLHDQDLAFLDALPALERLSLAGCESVTDRGTARLRRHDGIRRLDLRWTATGDGTVTALAGMPALYDLSLGTRLTDAGAAGLRAIPAFVTGSPAPAVLAVGSAARLTDRALESIGQLAGLASLDLSNWHYGGRFGSPGLAHLRRLPRLERLNLDGALATDAALEQIAGIARLRVLHCQDMIAGDRGFAALGACASLEEIWGRQCNAITDRGFEQLARLSRLCKLSLGGTGVSDGAMAALVELPALVELWPFLFGDAAFPFIARLPRLERLTNMYNRDTTDAATRHLAGHGRLVQYRAFGTQITDASLHILAGLPRLAEAEFENCAGITDEGLRILAGAPALKRLSARSCAGVRGEWVGSTRASIEAASAEGEAGEVESYRFETLLDYPDLPVPADLPGPPADPSEPRLVDRSVLLNCTARRDREGLVLTNAVLGPDGQPAASKIGYIGLLTRETFTAPLRVRAVVKPAAESRLYFGHRPIPVGMGGGEGTGAPPESDDWAEVTLEVDASEVRVLVSGVVRYRAAGEFAGLRSRVGLGPLGVSLTVRDLQVTGLPGAGGPTPSP